MAKKRSIQLDDLFKLQVVGGVAISPDGSQVVFELKRADPEDNKNYVNLMLVDVATGAQRKLTDGKHCDTLPAWAPDGKKLAFISNREKAGAIYVLPMEGGEPQRITDREGNVGEFRWSPNGRKLAFTYTPMTEREKLERDGKGEEAAKLPQFKHITRLHHKLDGVGWWNGNYAHIHVISAAGGKPTQLTHGKFDDSEPRFSPDGKQVSFVSNRLDDPDMHSWNSDVHVVKATGGPAKRLTQMPGFCFGHSWSPDGRQIAYVGDPAKSHRDHRHNARIWLVSSKGGHPRELTRDIDANCYNAVIGDVTGVSFGAAPPIWSADSQRVYFLVTTRGCCHLYSKSLARGKSRCVVGGDINLMAFQRTAKDGPIAVTIGAFDNPGDVFVLDPDADEPRRLTHLNETVLKRIQLAQREAFYVKSGKVEVPAWVLKPPGFNPRKKYPAILEVHGGPQAAYGESFFHEMQLLAAKGYVVVYSNPRGSDSYGLDYRACIHGDWGNRDWQDVTKVTDWMARQRYIDKTRIGITGGSYGGYMTNWAVTHTNRYRAAVTQRSVVSFETMFGSSDFGYELGQIFGGTPWRQLKRYRQQSPLTLVEKIKTPLLIIHSEQDLRCPIAEAEQLFTSLKVLGRETELVRFEGESHGLSRGGRPQNRAERLRRILAWFDARMK